MVQVGCLSILLLSATCFAAPELRGDSGRDSRIVNGVEAAPGEYPHQVEVQYRELHQCGSSILNEYWVLTAAHCVLPQYPEQFRILAGTQDLENGGTIHNIDVIINHEQYDPVTSHNDISVIKVLTPLNIDGVTLKPIKLPQQDQVTPEGAAATVIGWGFNSTNENYLPARLRKVDILIGDHKKCEDIYWEYKEYPIYDSMICGDTPAGNKGFCSGDSGGPLLVNGEIVGIVSFARQGCTYVGYPGVYTRAASFRNWIQEVTGV